MVKYTVDQLNGIDSFEFRSIPSDDPRFDDLRRFGQNKVNLVDVINRMQQKKANGTMNQYTGNRGGKRPNAHFQRNFQKAERPKFYDEHAESAIFRDIRDILLKISPTNKDKLLDIFMQTIGDFPSEGEDAEKMVKNFYEFSIDCDILLELYVELFSILKDKNSPLFEKLLAYIRQQVKEPRIFDENDKTKRWRKNGIKLLIEMYAKKLVIIEDLTEPLSTIFESLESSEQQGTDKWVLDIETVVTIILGLPDNDLKEWIKRLVTFKDKALKEKALSVRLEFMIDDVIEKSCC